MICPKCNSENEDFARFCENCGFHLEDLPTEKAEPLTAVTEPEADDGDGDDQSEEVLSAEVVEITPVDTKGTGSENNNSSAGKKQKVLIFALLAVILVLVIILIAKPHGHESYPAENTDYNSADYSGTEQDSADAASYSNDIPEELRPYADRLVEENRLYVVSLEHDDWNIRARSTPEYFKDDESYDNTVGLIKSGTEIYVEYICDGLWAVYQIKGRYVFSSIYDANDMTKMEMIIPK